jgi:tricorn protease
MFDRAAAALAVLALASLPWPARAASLPLPAPSAALAEGRAGLLFQPDIHGDFVVFVHSGDLWRAPAAGGEARRLTSHTGQELYPKFSPDGSQIAFSAEYSGSRQVWVMPSEGGQPRQLTFYTDVGPLPPRGGTDAWVLGWSPDGKILVRLNRTPWSDRMGRYFLVDPAGGLEVPLPPPHGGSASFSPDGKSLAYTPIDREFRTWKRSLGGRAQDLWIYDLAGSQSRRLTDWRGTDNFPMWLGDTIYFTSDRDYTLNLFAYDLPTGKTTQLTRFSEFDVLWPSAGAGGSRRQIVFTAGGELYRYAPGEAEASKIPITLHSELAATVPRFEDVADNIAAFALSPSSKRVLFEARGDIFSVPAEKGNVRNLTLTQGVRERDPDWSADGKNIVYLSDATGEYEIYLRPADGSEPPRQLTKNSDVWLFAPRFSADGKKIAYADRNRRLWVLEVESGKQTEVDRGFREDLDNFAWSPDSRFLVYERTREESRLAGLSLYSLEEKKVYRLGDGLSIDNQPAFSLDGKYLFFLSFRDFKPTFSAFEFNYLYADAGRVYAVALDPEAAPLLPPQNDEELGLPAKEKDGDKEAAAKKASKPIRFDPEGFTARTISLPGIAPGTLGNLQAGDGAVYYLRFPGGDNNGPGNLERYDLASRKSDTALNGVVDYELSADGKKVLYKSGESYFLANAAASISPGFGKIDLQALRLKLDPRAEWNQFFTEGWRIARDWFYDPDMHGLDWPAMGKRYQALLPWASQRSDIDFLLGELIGELGAGHTYVRPGELAKAPRVGGGMLGAELVADPGAGRYLISRIYAGEAWDDNYRSPLLDPGVDAKEGDLILSIDGQDLRLADNPYRLLEGKANSLVTLELLRKGAGEKPRKTMVRTIASEANLRYIDWVKSRLALVDKLSGGRVGYLHLPNTALEGNRMLQKLFYSQANKEALLIDDRYNGGGFIPDRMIEYFGRTPLAAWAMRGIDAMRTPAFAHYGPKAMLVNGYSSSGGDALPFFFRQQGLGKLIGSRTWGGLIGLNGSPNFADGGGVDICTFRIYDAQGNWVVENEGVVPDYEVFDLAESLAAGGDPSIEKGVAVLLEELAAKGKRWPPSPPAPDLSRKGWPGQGLQ